MVLTFQEWLLLFKEGVTAVIAFAIIGATLLFFGIVAGYVGDPLKITDAKDLLVILTGLAGVVLGYYFGRVPADARAIRAITEANTAIADNAVVKAKMADTSNEIRKEITRINDQMNATTTVLIPGSTASTIFVKDILDNLNRIDEKISK
jgi:hypothetical protein